MDRKESDILSEELLFSLSTRPQFNLFLNLFIKLDQLKTEFKKRYKIEESDKLNLITNLNKLLKWLENLKPNSEKSWLQLDQQFALVEKSLNFTKALLLFMSLLAIIQILEIFAVF